MHGHLNVKYILLTPWSTVLHEKLTGFQLVKKFPAFHGNRRFNKAFTSAHLDNTIGKDAERYSRPEQIRNNDPSFRTKQTRAHQQCQRYYYNQHT